MESWKSSELSDAARSMWAKSGDGQSWMPLHQHMIDSAEVGGRLWDDWAPESLQRTLSSHTGLERDEVKALLQWLAGTHDIGKASKWFASQLDRRPEYAHYSTRISGAGVPLRKSVEDVHRIPHGTASGIIITEWLADHFQYTRQGAARVAAIADAHHGIPTTDTALLESAGFVLGDYQPEWFDVWDELLQLLTTRTCAEPVLHKIAARKKKTLSTQSQLLLTGLVIMADWIASNQEAFPLGTDSAQAARTDFGVNSIALTPPWRPLPLDDHGENMRDRFAWPAEAEPRPVQAALAGLAAEATEPTLFIVEAPTGEGKTEAALTAAEYLAARLGTGGVFFGAPTMSTSDALFTRISAWARRAVPQHDIASLFLGHSKAALNEDFAALRFSRIGESEGGNVIASQWLSGRKKG
ncbi:MAG: CRISPR-associated endonuclease Cas3'', partial [Microbacteriaceae bacterium]|nr:CRISPR-associated endonuclease Cas3'' [Microbacteriaceae bacterium]